MQVIIKLKALSCDFCTPTQQTLPADALLRSRFCFHILERDFSLSESWLDTQRIEQEEQKTFHFLCRVVLSHTYNDNLSRQKQKQALLMDLF